MSSGNLDSAGWAGRHRQSAAPRRSAKISGLVLVALSLAITLLALELSLRVQLHLRNSGLLAALPSDGVEVPADGRAELGHIIRPAEQHGVVYELKPGLAVVYQGAEVFTDAAGFRTDTSGRRSNAAAGSRAGAAGAGTRGGGDAAPPDAAGGGTAFCVIGIGDSFMFGQGVAGSETYLSVLQRRLQQAYPARRVGVVNTAVPGYNTAMEVATLRAKGLPYSPDVVIIEFVGNDLSLPNFVLAPSKPWSLRRSFLGDFLRERLGLRRDTSLWRRLQDAGLQGIPQDDPDGIGNATEPSQVPAELRDLVGWESFDASMHELQRLSETHHFEVVAISLDPADPPLERRALELSRRLGFHVFDVGAVLSDYLDANNFAEYLGSPLALSAVDGHPSALAHRMAGETLAGFLDAQILNGSKPEAR